VTSFHDLSASAKHALDGVVFAAAGLAAFGFWQGVALALTIISTCIAILLGGLRVYDRLAYGPVKRG
jgi:uncharacterized oligopeptide transporter (OPT) family protein